MDPRQRGIAHVNIFWCLVPIVLFFGAVGYAYVKHTEADENKVAMLAAKVKEGHANKVRVERENQLDSLTETLGNPGAYSAPMVAIANYTPPNQWTTVKKLRDVFAEFKLAMAIPGSLNKLDDVLGAARQTLTAKNDSVGTLAKSVADVRGQRDAAQRSVTDTQNTLNAKIGELEGNVQAEQRRIDSTIATQSRETQDLRDKVTTANAARETAIKDSQAKLAAKAVELRNLHAAAQRRADLVKLINSPDEADGVVTGSSPTTGFAWIGIGAKDGVKGGMTFRFLEPVKGGTFKAKGHGVVIEVKHDQAKVKVTSLLNDKNPIVRNDIVTNELFTPGLSRNVYLLGRFSTPLSKPEIKKILEKMGHTVLAKMSPSVDLVVVGRENVGEEVTPLAETDAYKQAAGWDIEIAPLYKIRDFLKL